MKAILRYFGYGISLSSIIFLLLVFFTQKGMPEYYFSNAVIISIFGFLFGLLLQGSIEIGIKIGTKQGEEEEEEK